MTGRSAHEAYSSLQRLARAQGRTTQQLLELYVHERFLARVAESRYAERLVLKGGMLLAVLDARRATRDADMLARGVANDEANLRGLVSEIAQIPMADGVSFDTADVSVVVIREEAEYQGLRIVLPVGVSRAVLKLRLDLAFGDPVDPRRVEYPTLLDDPPFPLLGYPAESVIAEKAETMMALGDANTRDRDFGDIYVLSEIHPIDGAAMREALLKVAAHRGREVRGLGPMLMTLRESRQRSWEAFRARVGPSGLPERFSDVVDRVIDVVDGVQAAEASRWNPAHGRWER